MTAVLKEFGFPVMVAVVLLYFGLTKASKKLDEITKLLHIISVNVGKTMLQPEQAIQVFKWCLSDHIQRKLDFAREKLIMNHISERKDKIKLALKNEFYRITQEEAQSLSQFNTPAGDMGKILMNINFDVFMNAIFEIFFGEGDVEKKCGDLRSLMDGYVNDLVREIQTKIAKSHI